MGWDGLSLDGEAVMTQASCCHDHRLKKNKYQGMCWNRLEENLSMPHGCPRSVGPQWALLSACQLLFMPGGTHGQA